MLPLYDVNPHRRTPVVVVILLIANVALFLAEIVQYQRGARSIVGDWSLVPAKLWRGFDAHVWLTAITAMFLHGGWMHLIGNGWFLWIFGNNIEDRLGHGRFIVFYLLSGIAATAAQVAFAPTSPLPMLGASGAISGILGAYMRYFPATPIVTLVPFIVPILPVPAFVFTGIWFVFQFTQGIREWNATGAEGGVAWWAHIGGFLAGLWRAGVLRPRRSRSKG